MNREMLGSVSGVINPNAGVHDAIDVPRSLDGARNYRIRSLPRSVPQFGKVVDSHGRPYTVTQIVLPVGKQVDDDLRKKREEEKKVISESLGDKAFESLAPLVNNPNIKRIMKGSPQDPHRAWREGNTTCGYQFIDGKWCVVEILFTDPYKNR